MPFTGPLEDRIAIRELYDTYADGANRADAAVWTGCFAADGRWKTHYFDLVGHEAIAAQYAEINIGVADTFVSSQVLSIEVMGDSARCRALQDESLLYESGATYALTGLYEDELVRRGGRWQFLFRNYLVKREKLPEQA